MHEYIFLQSHMALSYPHIIHCLKNNIFSSHNNSSIWMICGNVLNTTHHIDKSTLQLNSCSGLAIQKCHGNSEACHQMLYWASSIHLPSSQPISISFILILSSHLILFVFKVQIGNPIKNSVCLSSLHPLGYMPRPL